MLGNRHGRCRHLSTVAGVVGGGAVVGKGPVVGVVGGGSVAMVVLPKTRPTRAMAVESWSSWSRHTGGRPRQSPDQPSRNSSTVENRTWIVRTVPAGNAARHVRTQSMPAGFDTKRSWLPSTRLSGSMPTFTSTSFGVVGGGGVGGVGGGA